MLRTTTSTTQKRQTALRLIGFEAAGEFDGRLQSSSRIYSDLMRPTPMDLFAEMEDPGSAIAMDVDDVDPLEIFGEGVIPADNKLADADFFNNFEDDFDDSDIN